MDAHDSRKIVTSEHESSHGGVHLCHKCGWPFPNSHPSAKHRRAHKKICGKIEGYECSSSEGSSLHLTVSEDGQISDDDLKTPSPKVLKSVKTNVDCSSGGVGEVSNRSGHEVFLDADTEFSDARPSPGLVEHKGGAKDLVSDLRKSFEEEAITTLLDKESDAAVPVNSDIPDYVTINPSSLIQTKDGVEKGDGKFSEEKDLVSHNESVLVTPNQAESITSLYGNSLNEPGPTFSKSDTIPELESVVVSGDKVEGCDSKGEGNSSEHLKDGNRKLMAEVMPAEEETKMLDVMDNGEKILSNDVMPGIEKTLTVSSFEEQVPQVSDTDPSENIIQDHDTNAWSDTGLLVSLMKADNNQTKNLVCGDDTGNLDKAWDIEQRENIADPDNAEIRISGVNASHLIETHNEDSQEIREEPERSSKNTVILESPVATSTDLNCGGDVKLVYDTLEKPTVEEPPLSPIQSYVAVEDGQARVLDESLQEEGDKSRIKQQSGVSAVDVSVDSLSQTDSLEGNWGSVSDATGLSALSDAIAIVDSEALLPLTNSQASAIAKKANNSDDADIFEPPSFMTLVEPKDGGTNPNVTASEIQNLQQLNSASSQTGWFPSVTHVANDSLGRKKNEEVINKVKNWTTVKQHIPLKSLIGESNTEVRQKDGITTKKDSNLVTNVNTILDLDEPPIATAIKAETGKEWSSPAQYPAEIKRERRKTKGKPYWVPFVCCSSVS